MGELTLEMHDCSHKFVDDTKTMVQLFLRDLRNLTPISIGYCATSDDMDKVRENPEKYLDAILQCMKENVIIKM